MSDALLATADTAARSPAPVAPMTLYVCTTCRTADQSADREHVGERAGARLYAALVEEAGDPAVVIEPVECLSVCKRVCTVAFAAPGKWTYIHGDLSPETTAPAILQGARLYAESENGLVPWKLRPEPLRKGLVARVPPLPGTSRSGSA